MLANRNGRTRWETVSGHSSTLILRIQMLFHVNFISNSHPHLPCRIERDQAKAEAVKQACRLVMMAVTHAVFDDCSHEVELEHQGGMELSLPA
eukprot:749031-Hanusia_phi.AAC.2